MSKTYKLHELIEMAKSGKRFGASCDDLAEILYANDFLSVDRFDIQAICADWEVTFEREPRVYFIQKGETIS